MNFEQVVELIAMKRKSRDKQLCRYRACNEAIAILRAGDCSKSDIEALEEGAEQYFAGYKSLEADIDRLGRSKNVLLRKRAKRAGSAKCVRSAKKPNKCSA